MNTISALTWRVLLIAASTVALTIMLVGSSLAHADEPSRTLLRPDPSVVDAAPIRYDDEGGWTLYYFAITNKGAPLVSSQPTTTKVTFQPVTQLIINGQIQQMIDFTGQRPFITKTGSTPSISYLGTDLTAVVFSRSGDPRPYGRYRITTCADAEAVQVEAGETNNCTTRTQIL